MRDALTIVVVHISRQQGQSLLHVGQEFRLKAGPDFLQRVDEPGHFVGPDPPVQREPIEPCASVNSIDDLPDRRRSNTWRPPRARHRGQARSCPGATVLTPVVADEFAQVLVAMMASVRARRLSRRYPRPSFSASAATSRARLVRAACSSIAAPISLFSAHRVDLPGDRSVRMTASSTRPRHRPRLIPSHAAICSTPISAGRSAAGRACSSGGAASDHRRAPIFFVPSDFV